MVMLVFLVILAMLVILVIWVSVVISVIRLILVILSILVILAVLVAVASFGPIWKPIHQPYIGAHTRGLPHIHTLTPEYSYIGDPPM